MRLYSLPAIFICELKTESFSPSTSVQTKPTEWVHLKREHDLTFNLSICQFYRLLKWSRNIKKSEKGLLFESWSRWRGHFFWLTLVVTHTCIGSGCKHRVKYKPLWLRNFLDYVFLSGKVFPIWMLTYVHLSVFAAEHFPENAEHYNWDENAAADEGKRIQWSHCGEWLLIPTW